MTERQRFLAGLAAGLLALAVCIEAVRAIHTHGWVCAFDNVLWWVGRFRWLEEYQTFLTGAGAVVAATLSIRAVRDQIKSSDAAVNLQIKHAGELEAARVDAKRSAARAVLPLALASVSDYAEKTADALRDLHGLCVRGFLPGSTTLPQFPSLPDNIIGPIKEMIEFVDPDDRQYMWQMLVRIQVLQSRVAGMIKSHTRGSSVSASNIEAYILDSSEIYARSSGLYKFARGAVERPPEIITHQDIADGLHQVGIFDDLYDELVAKYQLKSAQKWGERWLAS